MRIYVGGLAWAVTDEDLHGAFSAYGQVSSASVARDRFSNKSRGFGFVDMPNDPEAKLAIEALNGKDLAGRTMTVNEARPKEAGGPRRY